MKKIAVALLIAALAAASNAHAATTLYEYFTQRGLPLPSVRQRAPSAADCGIADYRGTAAQNILLLRCLEEKITIGAGNPTTATNWTLATAATISDTTFTLSGVNDLRSNAVATTSLPLKVYFGVEAENSDNFEIIVCPRSGFDQLNKQFNNCTRGLAFSGSSEAQVAANRRAHAAGASFNQTNVGQFFNLFGGIYDSNTWEDHQIFGHSTNTSPYIQVGTSTSYVSRILFGNPDTGAYIQSTSSQLSFCEGTTPSCYDPASGGSGLFAARPIRIGKNTASELTIDTSTDWFILDGSNNLAGNASSTGGILADANGIAFDEADSFDNLSGNWRFADNTIFVGSQQIATGTALVALTATSTENVNYLHQHTATTGSFFIARNFTAGNSVTITHSLGKTPQYIELNAVRASATIVAESTGVARNTYIDDSIHWSTSGSAFDAGQSATSSITITDQTGVVLTAASSTGMNASTFILRVGVNNSAGIGDTFVRWKAWP